MDDKRQKNQLVLAFMEEYKGEAPNIFLSVNPESWATSHCAPEGKRDPIRPRLSYNHG